MSQLAAILFKRLGNLQLDSCEINRLIKDVSNTIGRQSSFKTTHVKQSLENLGWEEHILDNRTLELLFVFIENESGCQLNQYG